MTKNKMWRSLNHVIGVISQCDVILRCKDELFVGLYYDTDVADSPVVVCKGAWDFNYYLTKVAELNGTPCVDNQSLARSLYEELKEGDVISPKYIKSVAVVYSNLETFKDKKEKSEFYAQLNNDAVAKIYNLEKTVYRQVERKYFKNQKVCENLYEGEVVKYFTEELRILAEDNELNFRTFHSAAYKSDEFYLETYFEKYDLDFWQLVFVSEKDKKIYVGSKTFFHLFDFTEADIALGFVKALVEAWKGVLWNDAQKFIEEFEINPRLFDIAQNSIKTMVEMNYNQNGYEYGFDFDKTCAIIYLKKKEISEDIKAAIMALGFQPKTKGEASKKARKGPRMYEVLITYNEFLRHPDVFKDFIKEPKTFTKWNFWCKELKYNQEKFVKKFQTIEQ